MDEEELNLLREMLGDPELLEMYFQRLRENGVNFDRQEFDDYMNLFKNNLEDMTPETMPQEWQELYEALYKDLQKQDFIRDAAEDAVKKRRKEGSEEEKEKEKDRGTDGQNNTERDDKNGPENEQPAPIMNMNKLKELQRNIQQYPAPVGVIAGAGNDWLEELIEALQNEQLMEKYYESLITGTGTESVQIQNDFPTPDSFVQKMHEFADKLKEADVKNIPKELQEGLKKNLEDIRAAQQQQGAEQEKLPEKGKEQHKIISRLVEEEGVALSAAAGAESTHANLSLPMARAAQGHNNGIA